MSSIFIILAVCCFACVLLVKQASMSVWAISYAGMVLWFTHGHELSFFSQLGFGLIFVLLAANAYPPLRTRVLSNRIFDLIRRAMPTISATERAALEAGSIGWEAELLSGAPDFDRLNAAPFVQLTPEEQEFIDGPVQTLCRMIDEWDITHHRLDLPPELWLYLKKERFFGMIIPKKYGGLEFSATAQMSILTKLYGRSITVATTVGVPNSLGPAELLLKYGTEAQKNYYLPRLAEGREIPCFALTGPNAGSDAASIPDQGIVCRQVVDGQEVLGIQLNWDKRYITLCPVATLIGLAFRLFDPENLLGKGCDVGISCALIPANTPGVLKGRRHFPLNVPFQNGPTQGHNVFISMDQLIGGGAMAGQGWKMLMECLSVGRAISLPSSASGGAQVAALACSAYARIRKQFNQPIAKFEGIEEALARIAGKTYLIDAALSMTVSVIDQNEKSAVAGAILKYHTTEWSRQISMDAMDIHGGKGICLGPNNYLGRGHQATPIAITVEGANILTRSLIIYGQGAIRSHRYVLSEIESIQNQDYQAFDQALWGHVSLTLSNLVKSFIFGFTHGRWTQAPLGPVKRYYQYIHRYSANLAFLSDFSMMMLGAQLKRKETISARLGDMLSYLYVASGVLKRFHEDGELPTDLPLVEWSCQYLLHECHLAMQGVIMNFPVRWARYFLKGILNPLNVYVSKPSDQLGQKLARLVTNPSGARRRLTRLVFSEPHENCPLGKLEEAFHKLCQVGALEKKVAQGVRDGLIHSLTLFEQIEEAAALKLLSPEEAIQLNHAEKARQAVIAVDDFSHETLMKHHDGLKQEVKQTPQSVPA